mmetsp:Transcript_25357/g.57769  ORF Transcript_25357/g.57769 Transcript_25357/m.57769 type:complete len:222 (-) Transcript_25357:396-1061(-)
MFTMIVACDPGHVRQREPTPLSHMRPAEIRSHDLEARLLTDDERCASLGGDNPEDRRRCRRQHHQVGGRLEGDTDFDWALIEELGDLEACACLDGCPADKFLPPIVLILLAMKVLLHTSVPVSFLMLIEPCIQRTRWVESIHATAVPANDLDALISLDRIFAQHAAILPPRLVNPIVAGDSAKDARSTCLAVLRVEEFWDMYHAYAVRKACPIRSALEAAL